MQDKKAVIFDFDGVLVDSFWLTHKTAKKEYPELTEVEHRDGFEGNIYEVEKHWAHKTRNAIDYFEEYAKETHLVKFFKVEDVVRKLAEKYLLAIVSSTTSSLIKTFLEREKLLEYFPDILGADVHTSKHEKIKMLFERHRLIAADCVMVTDTLGDIREARSVGVDSIGVSWGFHEIERLQKEKTFRIIHTPEEIVPAVHDYFSR